MTDVERSGQTRRHIGMYETAPHRIPLPAVVCLRCDRCGRRGQYPRRRYHELAYSEGWGSDLLTFAKRVQCPVALAQTKQSYGDRCQIVHDWTPEQKSAIMDGRAPE